MGLGIDWCTQNKIHVNGTAQWIVTWWRHQVETFSALLAHCAGNSPVTGEFLSQRPVKRGFDVFFDLRLNRRFSKQSWGWWLETLSRPLWRYCNVQVLFGSELILHKMLIARVYHTIFSKNIHALVRLLTGKLQTCTGSWFIDNNFALNMVVFTTKQDF